MTMLFYLSHILCCAHVLSLSEFVSYMLVIKPTNSLLCDFWMYLMQHLNSL